MSPALIFPLIIAAFIGGGIFYSYHTGLEHGERICNEEKALRELEKTKNELFIKEEFSKFQAGQIGEAQQLLEQSNVELENLRGKLIEATSDSTYCIPDSVLDAIRQYRAPAGKNTKPTSKR